jgi:ribosomal-protein-alanine N-acetyltransferase
VVGISTERLRLEPLRVAHAALVFEPLSDERIYEFIEDAPSTSIAVLEERFAALQRGCSPAGNELWLNWIAFTEDGNQPVGWFQSTVYEDRTAEIAYIVFPEFWRRGYAREACRAVLAHLADALGCTKAVAHMDTHNAASVRLVETLGFVRQEVIPGAAVIRGRTADEYRYEQVLGGGAVR